MNAARGGVSQEMVFHLYLKHRLKSGRQILFLHNSPKVMYFNRNPAAQYGHIDEPPQVIDEVPQWTDKSSREAPLTANTSIPFAPFPGYRLSLPGSFSGFLIPLGIAPPRPSAPISPYTALCGHSPAEGPRSFEEGHLPLLRKVASKTTNKPICSLRQQEMGRLRR